MSCNYYVSILDFLKGKFVKLGNQVSTNGGFSPRWRHDGWALFYVREGVILSTDVKSGVDSFQVGATTEALQRSFVYGNTIETPYDVFPDGQRFVITNVRKGTLHAPLTLITNWTAELKKK